MDGKFSKGIASAVFVQTLRPLKAAYPFKLRQVLADELPQDRRRNIFIAMAQNIADPGNLDPRNTRMTGLQLQRQVPTGFGNDFDTPLHKPVRLPVRFEFIERQLAEN